MRSPLSAEEPVAWSLHNGGGRGDVVLLCDHASNRVPAALGRLGLSDAQLDSHIAWDRGAYRVARALSDELDAPLVSSNYSRLLIDPNRQPDHPDLIARQSDSIPIPGNHGLSAEDAAARRGIFYDPYHQAIDALLMARGGRTKFLLSIHSFTPVLAGVARPWQIGVCYDKQCDLASRWLAALRRDGELCVGDNQPYAIEPDIDYTLPTHGQRHGLDALMLEIRENEIRSDEQARRWAGIIADAYNDFRSGYQSRSSGI